MNEQRSPLETATADLVISELILAEAAQAQLAAWRAYKEYKMPPSYGGVPSLHGIAQQEELFRKFMEAAEKVHEATEAWTKHRAEVDALWDTRKV